jgi:tRNA modification GTPase
LALRILASMSSHHYDTQDIIYALATGWTDSPIAVIRISGLGCIAQLAPLFSRPKALLQARSHTLVHGNIIDPHTSEPVDEVLVALFTNGRGYTGEESAEISCHGTFVAIEAIFAVLKNSGMRAAEPGEFTFRAFMNGKIDLTQAEAVQEILTSGSHSAHALALRRLEGGLFDRIEAIKALLIEAVATVELQLDYAEDEAEAQSQFPFKAVVKAQKLTEALLDTYSLGRLYQMGAHIVIAGPTNAGKSTLFNLLVGHERSIVSEIHGTTRDFIEATADLDGIPITLYDTAGLRLSEDAIELEGIKRSHQLIEKADVIILIFDGSQQITDYSAQYAQLLADERCIPVWNKSDVAFEQPLSGFYPLSAKTAEGFEQLHKELIRRIRGGLPKPAGSAVVIESKRQHDELLRAHQALTEVLKQAHLELPLDVVAVELAEALDALGSLTGEVSSADILQHIFSQFCVGK